MVPVKYQPHPAAIPPSDNPPSAISPIAIQFYSPLGGRGITSPNSKSDRNSGLNIQRVSSAARYVIVGKNHSLRMASDE